MSFDNWQKENEKLSGFNAWQQENIAILNKPDLGPKDTNEVVVEAGKSWDMSDELNLPIAIIDENYDEIMGIADPDEGPEPEPTDIKTVPLVEDDEEITAFEVSPEEKSLLKSIFGYEGAAKPESYWTMNPVKRAAFDIYMAGRHILTRIGGKMVTEVGLADTKEVKDLYDAELRDNPKWYQKSPEVLGWTAEKAMEWYALTGLFKITRLGSLLKTVGQKLAAPFLIKAIVTKGGQQTLKVLSKEGLKKVGKDGLVAFLKHAPENTAFLTTWSVGGAALKGEDKTEAVWSGALWGIGLSALTPAAGVVGKVFIATKAGGAIREVTIKAYNELWRKFPQLMNAGRKPFSDEFLAEARRQFKSRFGYYPNAAETTKLKEVTRRIGKEITKAAEKDVAMKAYWNSGAKRAHVVSKEVKKAAEIAKKPPVAPSVAKVPAKAIKAPPKATEAAEASKAIIKAKSEQLKLIKKRDIELDKAATGIAAKFESQIGEDGLTRVEAQQKALVEIKQEQLLIREKFDVQIDPISKKIADLSQPTPAEPKQAWETSDLATAPNIPDSAVKVEKQAGGKWKLFFRGTTNEVFQGELFNSATEARNFFKVQKLKAQQSAKDAIAKLEPKKALKKETPKERKHFVELLLSERQRIQKEMVDNEIERWPEAEQQRYKKQLDEIDRDLRRRGYTGEKITIKPKAKLEPSKETPPVGGKETGFVDLAPLAEAGKQVRTLEDKITKLTTRFTGLESEVQKVLIEYEEQIKELPTVAANISKDIGLVDLTEEQERLIEDFREQGEKFPEKFPKGLPPELQDKYDVLIAGIENARERLREIGASANWPEGQIEFLKEKLNDLNAAEKPDIQAIETTEEAIDDLKSLQYLHHAYSKISNEKIRKWFSGKKITKKPIGLLGRKFPTLEIAEKAGFTRAPLAVSYADMWSKVMRAEQADQLIKAINGNPNLSLWAEEAPSDWVTIREEIFPASVSHTTYTDKSGKIKMRTRRRKYPQPVAEALEELTYTRGMHAFEAAYDKFNLAIKLVGFYNPIVMGKNDTVQMWRGAGVKGFINLPKAMKTFLAKGDTYHKLRKRGLFNNVVNYGPSVEVLAQNMIDHIRLTSGEKAAKAAAKWLNPKNFLQNLRQVQENTTWKMDEVFRIGLWHAVEDSKMLEGMSEFEKIEWTNDAMVNYGKLPKETKRWLTKAFYVPTYRIGNFRFWWGQLMKHPWKFKGPILRTLGYKTFVQYGLPAMIASVIAYKTKRRFDEVKGDVYVEKGYRLVIHNPETNADTVYALSDPLLEGAKVSQREFRRTLELNLAAAPAFIARVLQGRKRTATEDPLGEFFKLGTPFYKEIVIAKDKDKGRVQKILTHLAIAFTYRRQGREQDKVNKYEQVVRTLSLWTDWQAQKADIKAMWTGKAYYYGPGGEFGRLLREFEADKKIKISKIDKDIDDALYAGKEIDAVKIALENERYKTPEGLVSRFARHQQPLVYIEKTMSREDKLKFFQWLKDNKKVDDDEIAKLIKNVAK